MQHDTNVTLMNLNDRKTRKKCDDLIGNQLTLLDNATILILWFFSSSDFIRARLSFLALAYLRFHTTFMCRPPIHWANFGNLNNFSVDSSRIERNTSMFDVCLWKAKERKKKRTFFRRQNNSKSIPICIGITKELFIKAVPLCDPEREFYFISKNRSCHNQCWNAREQNIMVGVRWALSEWNTNSLGEMWAFGWIFDVEWAMCWYRNRRPAESEIVDPQMVIGHKGLVVRIISFRWNFSLICGPRTIVWSLCHWNS